MFTEGIKRPIRPFYSLFEGRIPRWGDSAAKRTETGNWGG
jgi:hypothetical protein